MEGWNGACVVRGGGRICSHKIVVGGRSTDVANVACNASWPRLITVLRRM